MLLTVEPAHRMSPSKPPAATSLHLKRPAASEPRAVEPTPAMERYDRE